MMYKVKVGTVPRYIGELFSNSISQYDMRDNERLNLPRFNTVQYGKNSLQYLGAKLWNNIPISIKRSSSLNTFKSAITKWLYTCDLSLIYQNIINQFSFFFQIYCRQLCCLIVPNFDPSINRMKSSDTGMDTINMDSVVIFVLKLQM